MQIRKIRSSSINSYKFCPWQFFLEYVLEMESLSGKSALQGTIVHSVLQWIALSKTKGLKQPDHIKLLEKSWKYHLDRNPHITNLRRTTSRGDAADYKKCLYSIEKVLESIYNPYKLNIIATEHTFNLPLPDDDLKDQVLSGTIDMVHKLNDDTLEIVDWKSGKRKDWATLKDKDFYDLMKDVQPRIYHLACFLMYPQYKNIIATFYYINDGGPVTLPFTIEDLPYTMAAIRRFINTVKNDSNIYRNRSWKCKNFCHYGRHGICEQTWKDRYNKGLKFVETKYYGLTVENQRMICEK